MFPLLDIYVEGRVEEVLTVHGVPCAIMCLPISLAVLCAFTKIMV